MKRRKNFRQRNSDQLADDVAEVNQEDDEIVSVSELRELLSAKRTKTAFKAKAISVKEDISESRKDYGLKEKTVVDLDRTFTRQTNLLDTDKLMLDYIEKKLEEKRTGQSSVTVEDQRQILPTTGIEEKLRKIENLKQQLYSIPKNASRKAKDEGIANISASLLAKIPEVYMNDELSSTRAASSSGKKG